MKIYNNIDSISILNPYVTVGIFDGVHLGHQLIFDELKKFAQSDNGESVVITFWPHPKMIIDGSGDDLMMITSMEEKMELIKNQGIDNLIILPFTKEFSQLSSKDFIQHYLCAKLNIKGLIIGFDHRFGKDREGNFEVLQEYAIKYQFKIKKVDALSINNLKVSSTNIRNAILNGQMELANSYLSRNFSISGTVISGKRIGREIGFPTANIKPDFNLKLIPGDGVYAVKVLAKGNEYAGMLNIGNRPTVNSGNEAKSIEVHIIDFNGDLYDQKIELSFYLKLRNEVKFRDVVELKSQLNKDKQEIVKFFSEIKVKN